MSVVVTCPRCDRPQSSGGILEPCRTCGPAAPFFRPVTPAVRRLFPRLAEGTGAPRAAAPAIDPGDVYGVYYGA